MKTFTIILCLFCFSCALNLDQTDTINGLSVVASPKKITDQNLVPILNTNANYATLMPFGFIENIKKPTVYYNMDQQWFGETEIGIKQYTKQLRKNNMNIMLKPQLWVSHGVYTGQIKMESEEDWLILEKTYSAFILDYAALAETLKIPILCIATELELFIKHRPSYWKALIIQIKKTYSGKLTYAANWDEYTRTSFWDQLDYIGVDAYFPVSTEKTPTIERLRSGWKKHKANMKKVSDSLQKKILFTEFGYRSVDFCGVKPWEVTRIENKVNLKGQANATQVLFEEFWEEKWFAGGFIWKWFIDYENVGGTENNRFTPQNKPAELIVKKHFKNK